MDHTCTDHVLAEEMTWNTGSLRQGTDSCERTAYLSLILGYQQELTMYEQMFYFSVFKDEIQTHQGSERRHIH